MAGDVVGTAYVRIKALTDQLSKDIEKTVKKAMKDADLEKAAKDKGEETGEDFGDGVADGASKTLKKRSKDMVPGDEIDDEFGKIIKRTNKQFGQLSFDDALEGIRENFKQLELDFPEFDDIDIDVDVDTDRVISGFELLDERLLDFREKLGESFEFPDVDPPRIEPVFDTEQFDDAFTVFQRKFDEFRSRAENRRRPIKIFEVDDSALRRSLRVESESLDRVKERFRSLRDELGEKIDVPSFDLPFDEGRVNNFFRRFKSGLADNDAATQNWAGRLRTRFSRLGDDIDRGPLNRALDGLNAKLRGLGDVGLPSIGRLGATLALIGGAIIGALPYIQDVGSAVLAYATGLVAQVGFLGTALAGLGVAAAAAIGSAVTAALPIFLAFKAETEELTAFKDSVAAAGEEFQRIGVATQQTLLPALDDALFVLGDLVPLFSEFGLFVGRAVGNYAKLATGILVGEIAQRRFQTILQSSLRILDILLPTIINFGDILSGIWVAAAPAAERFVGVIGDLVDRWADVVNEGLRTGELTELFDLWLDRALTLGSALGNLSGALIDIFEVGATAAGDLFVRFDEWAERFRAFTESEAGQNRLALIFENSLAVMREVNAIVADIFDGIFGRLGEVGGVDNMVAALQRFRDVIPEIQEFWANALVVIDRVVRLFASTVWEKITTAWEQMEEPLGRLVEQFFDLLQVMNDSGAFDVFLDLMETLTNVLSTLLAIPGFGQFIAYMIAFGAASRVASIALGPFLRLFGGVGALLLNMVRARMGLQLAGMAGGLTQLASGFRAVAAAQAAGGVFSTLGQAMQAGAGRANSLAGALGGAVRQLGLLGPAGITAAGVIGVAGFSFFRAQQQSQKWRQEIRQATEALGLLNDGLNITAEGVAKYVNETSRFNSRDQIDDLDRMGFSAKELGEQVANGTLSYVNFADAALAADEIFISVNDRTRENTDSLATLGRRYDLTNEQMNNLAKGQEVYADGTKLALAGNDSLLESFEELNKVIGAAAKESIDEFVSNAQNVRLLGAGFLSDLRKDVTNAEDEDAGQILAAGQEALAAAAVKSSAAIKGLSDATRDQIREQSLMADGTVDVLKENQLLTDAITKQNTELRENLELFAGPKFRSYYPEAKTAVLDFLTVFEDINVPAFDELGVDEMVAQFPDAVAATDELFRALQGLPEDEFNAAAAALGADAEALKDAMNGAQQAIIDLQNQALESLPSVGELLDEATKTREDGSQYFDEKGFVQGVQDRTRDTIEFGANIEKVTKQLGVEAGILAAQQGPEAAANLSKITGTDAAALQVTLANMESAETFLKEQIASNLGPAIRTQFLDTGAIWGDGLTTGIAGGLTSEAAQEALRGAGLDTINMLARGFQGEFVLEDGRLSFKHTGTFARFNPTKRPQSLNQKLLTAAAGGLVDLNGVNGMFSRVGTDIVPAMLTPGEYVNTAATVDRLGVDFFDSLNRGSTPAVPVPVGGGGINASGWTFITPDPEESGRQTISRLRTASFLLGGG